MNTVFTIPNIRNEELDLLEFFASPQSLENRFFGKLLPIKNYSHVHELFTNTIYQLYSAVL